MFFMQQGQYACKTVCRQDPEADSLRIDTEYADSRSDDSCGNRVEDPSSSGYEYVICKHVAGSQDQTAAEEIQENISGKQSFGPEHKGKDQDSGCVGEGCFHVDNADVAHISKAYQKQKLAGLS